MVKLIADSMGQLAEKAIKDRLIDINRDEPLSSNAWNEGYLNALTDAGLISETQYDSLMDWIKKDYS